MIHVGGWWNRNKRTVERPFQVSLLTFLYCFHYCRACLRDRFYLICMPFPLNILFHSLALWTRLDLTSSFLTLSFPVSGYRRASIGRAVFPYPRGTVVVFIHGKGKIDCSSIREICFRLAVHGFFMKWLTTLNIVSTIMLWTCSFSLFKHSLIVECTGRCERTAGERRNSSSVVHHWVERKLSVMK